MNIKYNTIGKILSGIHSGKFCKIEYLNQDDFLMTLFDDKMEEIESEYIASIEELRNLDLVIAYPHQYEEVNKETILNDFYDTYGKKEMHEYLETTQKKIEYLSVLIEDDKVRTILQNILKENVYIDFTMTTFLCRNLIQHPDYKKVSTKHQTIINDLLNIE